MPGSDVVKIHVDPEDLLTLGIASIPAVDAGSEDADTEASSLSQGDLTQTAHLSTCSFTV